MTIYQNVAALDTFFLAMLLHPEVQALAQKELESITQQGRLPTFSDDLPYIRAIAKECIRWKPPVPLGIRTCRPLSVFTLTGLLQAFLTEQLKTTFPLGITFPRKP
jgi:hypothetical protein